MYFYNYIIIQLYNCIISLCFNYIIGYSKYTHFSFYYIMDTVEVGLDIKSKRDTILNKYL